MVQRRAFLVAAGAATAVYGASGRTEPVRSLPSGNVLDPTYINPLFDSRSISAENPTGARGGGGKTGHGRKGSPARSFAPGEKVVLADLQGPGTVRHIWMTTDYSSPEVLRSQRLEVFYDGLTEPSISVPLTDFFGLPHGRHAEYYSALISVNEGLGMNFHIPIPFGRSMRMEFTNESKVSTFLFYQIDFTLEPTAPEPHSFLHVPFRRENPTVPLRDFVIFEGLRGPGRFLGCAVGIRVLDTRFWYGEGEVKMYRDGDQDFPTYCGTGLEDYVGSAWNLKRHYGYYSGAPINIPASADSHRNYEHRMPDFASFYRWHLPDPVMFSRELRVTIQQLGGAWFRKGEEREFGAYKASQPQTVDGWTTDPAKLGGDFIASARINRSDDYCATAYVYCQHPQAVTRYETDAAVRDIALLPGDTKFDGMTSDL